MNRFITLLLSTALLLVAVPQTKAQDETGLPQEVEELMGGTFFATFFFAQSLLKKIATADVSTEEARDAAILEASRIKGGLSVTLKQIDAAQHHFIDESGNGIGPIRGTVEKMNLQCDAVADYLRARHSGENANTAEATWRKVRAEVAQDLVAFGGIPLELVE